jgi:hypothetical protein
MGASSIHPLVSRRIIPESPTWQPATCEQPRQSSAWSIGTSIICHLLSVIDHPPAHFHRCPAFPSLDERAPRVGA